MGQETYIRRLRHDYGVPLKELAEAAGVSHQYMSDIELGKCNHNEDCKIMTQKAFERVIAQRLMQIQRLAKAYADNRCRLLDFVVEDDYEL